MPLDFAGRLLSGSYSHGRLPDVVGRRTNFQFFVGTWGSVEPLPRGASLLFPRGGDLLDPLKFEVRSGLAGSFLLSKNLRRFAGQRNPCGQESSKIFCEAGMTCGGAGVASRVRQNQEGGVA
jgi:hypothetical protein